MPDYLNEMGKWSKRFTIVLLVIIAFVCWGLLILGFVSEWNRPPNKPLELGPMITVVAIFGGSGLISVWMLARLMRRTRARNGVTMMPLWFIEAFGFAFGAAVCATAILFRQPWIFSIVVPTFCAMIFIRRNLAARSVSREHVPPPEGVDPNEIPGDRRARDHSNS
jgi:hypothetical protein